MPDTELNEAEKAVLGGCIENKDIFYRVVGKLDAGDFDLPAHKVIFSDLAELRESKGFADAASFLEYLETKKDLARIGGKSYIDTLLTYQPLSDEIDYYLDIIKDKSLARRFFDTVHGIEDSFRNNSVPDISEFIGEAERKIVDVTSQRRVSEFRTPDEVIKSLKAQFKENFAMRQKLNITDPYMTGYPSGYGDVDRLTGGFHPNDLIILAARPSVGKTALALNFAQKIAKGGKPVGLFSLEMSAEQIILRLLSNESGLPTNTIKGMDFEHLTPDFGDRDSSRYLLSQAIGQMNKEELLIDDTSALKLVDIVSKARKLKVKYPDLALIIIDYLGLITAPSRSNAGNRQQEVSDITRGLKAMARDLSVPVMVLAQLSRGVEARHTHRPILSDLRDSGSIEQDADMVFFIYRPDYYKDEGQEDSSRPGAYRKPEVTPPTDSNISQTTLILAKNRNGPIGDIDFYFYKDTCRFEAIASASHVGSDEDL